jgi:hypothetical protein
MEAECCLVEEQSFVLRSLHEQEAIWQNYLCAVDAYLRHCGYEPVSKAVEGTGAV